MAADSATSGATATGTEKRILRLDPRGAWLFNLKLRRMLEFPFALMLFNVARARDYLTFTLPGLNESSQLPSNTPADIRAMLTWDPLLSAPLHIRANSLKTWENEIVGEAKAT